MFRTVSQVLINYRGGPISAGAAGKVHGGDRLPWVKAGNSDNYALAGGDALAVARLRQTAPGRRTWRRDHKVPLTVFPWTQAHAAAGLKEDALYLMRPDSYVALAAEDGQGVERYFAEREIEP